MIGFMLATAFLSMSISNTATTLMLWPVVLAVVVEQRISPLIWLAGHLSILRNAPTWMMILAICARMTFMTEFTSNIASTTIMLPILATLAQSMEVKPLLLIVPAMLSASCACIMPIATPPNAVFLRAVGPRFGNWRRWVFS